MEIQLNLLLVLPVPRLHSHLQDPLSLHIPLRRLLAGLHLVLLPRLQRGHLYRIRPLLDLLVGQPFILIRVRQVGLLQDLLAGQPFILIRVRQVGLLQDLLAGQPFILIRVRQVGLLQDLLAGQPFILIRVRQAGLLRLRGPLLSQERLHGPVRPL